MWVLNLHVELAMITVPLRNMRPLKCIDSALTLLSQSSAFLPMHKPTCILFNVFTFSICFFHFRLILFCPLFCSKTKAKSTMCIELNNLHHSGFRLKQDAIFKIITLSVLKLCKL